MGESEMEPNSKNASIQEPGKGFALITGAAGGLGKAFAVECARRGWNLFLTDLRPEPLEILARSLQSVYGIRVLRFPCDLTDFDSRSALLEHLRKEPIRFEALFNVAGIDYEGLFFEQNRRQIRAILRLNMEGTLDMIHGVLPLRDPLRPFRILNVASLAAFYPMPVKAAYAASKRFLLDFSLALREEVREMGGTVTVLCPGGLPTTPEVIEAIDAQGLSGLLTTADIGGVAASSVEAMLRGQAVVIPGWINHCLRILGSLAPQSVVVRFIGRRWKQARSRRAVPESIIAWKMKDRGATMTPDSQEYINQAV
jgi:short-subunit dehydrogenase